MLSSIRMTATTLASFDFPVKMPFRTGITGILSLLLALPVVAVFIFPTFLMCKTDCMSDR